MIRIAVPLSFLSCLALLAGCGDTAPAPAEKGAASLQGDVQKGSISDEMIAADQLTSTAPAAKSISPEGGAATEDGARAGTPKSATSPEPAPTAAPVPAEASGEGE